LTQKTAKLFLALTLSGLMTLSGAGLLCYSHSARGLPTCSAATLDLPPTQVSASRTSSASESRPPTEPDSTIVYEGEVGAWTPPAVLCKWEQDASPCLEDGDPFHETPGAQFLPTLDFHVPKSVQYWVVVRSSEGLDSIAQVTVNVFRSLGPPEADAPLHRLVLQKVDKPELGIAACEAARDAGLITYQAGCSQVGIMNELAQPTTHVYMAEGVLPYGQPAGEYRVVADARDYCDVWASHDGMHLQNHFTYVPVCAVEIDFTTVNYGDIDVCTNKWIEGDKVFNEAGGVAPEHNRATVRNIGNVDLKITVEQDDMQFGFLGSRKNPAWNVEFDVRLGSNTSNEVTYLPYQRVTLPNMLPCGSADELNFSIHVKRATAGPHSGAMTIGCEPG